MANYQRILRDNKNARRSSPRRGTSFLEFIGCLIAVAVGAAAGSLYLGVDLKSYGLSALKSAGVIAIVDEPAAAAETVATAAPDAAPNSEAPSAEAAPAAVVPAAFEAPIASSTPGAVEPVHPAAAPVQAYKLSAKPVAELTDAERQALTAAYWSELAKHMQEEVAHRTDGIEDSGNLQLFEFLSARSEGHAAAAKAIAALSTRGVDPHVTAYAEKAQAWHEEGAKLYGRALDLLTDAPSAQLSGPFVQSWQSAATQHRMEESLLAEKHAAVQTYLNHSTSGG